MLPRIFTTFLLLVSFIVEANAAFTLENNEGNGSILGALPNFILTGSYSSTALGQVLTTYTDTFLSDTTVSFNWFYKTNDVSPFYDPAGYILGNTMIQLTTDFGPILQAGSISLTVPSGSKFGWYVLSTDDIVGSASLFVSATVSAVPEPSNSALIILGVGITIVIARKKSFKTH